MRATASADIGGRRKPRLTVTRPRRRRTLRENPGDPEADHAAADVGTGQTSRIRDDPPVLAPPPSPANHLSATIPVTDQGLAVPAIIRPLPEIARHVEDAGVGRRVGADHAGPALLREAKSVRDGRVSPGDRRVEHRRSGRGPRPPCCVGVGPRDPCRRRCYGVGPSSRRCACVSGGGCRRCRSRGYRGLERSRLSGDLEHETPRESGCGGPHRAGVQGCGSRAAGHLYAKPARGDGAWVAASAIRSSKKCGECGRSWLRGTATMSRPSSGTPRRWSARWIAPACATPRGPWFRFTKNGRRPKSGAAIHRRLRGWSSPRGRRERRSRRVLRRGSRCNSSASAPPAPLSGRRTGAAADHGRGDHRLPAPARVDSLEGRGELTRYSPGVPAPSLQAGGGGIRRPPSASWSGWTP